MPPELTTSCGQDAPVDGWAGGIKTTSVNDCGFEHWLKTAREPWIVGNQYKKKPNSIRGKRWAGPK